MHGRLFLFSVLLFFFSCQSDERTNKSVLKYNENVLADTSLNLNPFQGKLSDVSDLIVLEYVDLLMLTNSNVDCDYFDQSFSSISNKIYIKRTSKDFRTIDSLLNYFTDDTMLVPNDFRIHVSLMDSNSNLCFAFCLNQCGSFFFSKSNRYMHNTPLSKYIINRMSFWGFNDRGQKQIIDK